MKVNFTIRTKRMAMPKGISLVITGQAEFPKEMTRAGLIQELKEYGSSQFVYRGYNLSTDCISVKLG